MTQNYRNGDGGGSNTLGIVGNGSNPAASNVISYVTIATLGDAVDFGDRTVVSSYTGAAASNSNRTVFAGGQYAPSSAVTNTIEYVTIASTGNSADFGDLTIANSEFQGLSDSNGGLSE